MCITKGRPTNNRHHPAGWTWWQWSQSILVWYKYSNVGEGVSARIEVFKYLKLFLCTHGTICINMCIYSRIFVNYELIFSNMTFADNRLVADKLSLSLFDARKNSPLIVFQIILYIVWSYLNSHKIFAFASIEYMLRKLKHPQQ